MKINNSTFQKAATILMKLFSYSTIKNQCEIQMNWYENKKIKTGLK